MTKQAKMDLEDAPEGSLKLGKTKGCVQYYHWIEGMHGCGTYINKSNVSFAKKLAQKTYYEKILRYTNKVTTQISRLLKIYDDNKIENIFLEEHPERQKLITPIEPTYAQKLETWMSQPYEGKSFKEDAPVLLTNNGVRVRSKSEKIMADYFESQGIIYKYECPLKLKPYGTIYPDFTFISRKTGKEIYWEHEGMMDNPEYAKNAVQKIELYEKNGLYPGERLILTFETSANVINTEILKKLTRRYLL
ncbi:MAG: hypothetical protein MJ110_01215 [Lachnospiraceae bacterium]|nr:hypothetical protein [Lachnospiraceae bacterium]